MEKKNPIRIELKALLEMFAQNRLAMWEEINNLESANDCDRCALHVCPWRVEEEEKIVNEIIDLFLVRFCIGMIGNKDKVIDILREDADNEE